MFRDVLVVVDATEDAREALSHAIDLAQRERSRMTLITVEHRLPACAYLGAAAALPLVVPAAEAESRQILREALSHVPADVPVTTLLAAPPVRGALMTQIERGAHDLVIMGARPRSGRCPAFWSLSHYLVRRSPVPVLVVHGASPRGRADARAAAKRTRAQRWTTRSPAT
jgi:nucleotide-binding universal stress UspA family protein